MRRIVATAVLTGIAGLGLVACQEPARPFGSAPAALQVADPPAPLEPRVIAPQTTDPDIDWVPTFEPQFNLHYVWLDASRPANSKLFVFLSGAGPRSPRPRGHQLVQQEAARLGYHVIGLMYPTNVLTGVCDGDSDPECFEHVRMEIIDGIDRSTRVDVSRANSIDNRLTKLLLYLDEQYPSEGWSRFLHEGEPKWSQIAVGGHSFGAAQGALIGKIRHVDRVVMVAGPAAESAPWVSIGETPAAKYFELVHIRDHVATAIFANVSALELERFGEQVQVELSQPPYEGTHILVTDIEPVGGYVGTLSWEQLPSLGRERSDLGIDLRTL